MQNELCLEDDSFQIGDWNNLIDLPKEHHDDCFLEILRKHNYDSLTISIPLKGRYTKGRRWTKEEFESCYSAWKSGVSLTLIATTLNRNPQDMIYKLLDRCKEDGLKFTQRGRTETTKNWNSNVKACAEELFENGLPAWKVASIFKVDFEHVEKELFVNRKGYGHDKKNPFTINTDHKQFVNESIIQSINGVELSVLEAFAGEGRFTKTLVDSDTISNVTCIEKDIDTFTRLKENVKSQKATLINTDNIGILSQSSKNQFDIIDLDPFVTCHEQLKVVWKHLKDESYLFITFGGEYRRSFIKTNRKSIFERYGFTDVDQNNSEYFEEIPFYFLGFVAQQAYKNGFEFEVIRAVRYANNCRYWLKTTRVEDPKIWFSSQTELNKKGILFKQLDIPRFKEVRKEIDNAKKLGFSR